MIRRTGYTKKTIDKTNREAKSKRVEFTITENIKQNFNGMCMIKKNQHSVYTRLSRLHTVQSTISIAPREATTCSQNLVIHVYKYCFKCDDNYSNKFILKNQSIIIL